VSLLTAQSGSVIARVATQMAAKIGRHVELVGQVAFAQ
jgi:hypothetical protein